MTDNLLYNPGFEEGTYFFDPLGAVAIPNGWQVRFRGPDEPRLPGQDTAWGQPNAGVLDVLQVPEHERGIFFLSGTKCWKVWTGSTWPFHLSLSQKVDLTPGARYRFTAHVYPDMVMEYRPEGKVLADDPRAAGARLAAHAAGQAFSTPAVDGQSMPFGRYTALTLEFNAPAAEVEISLEAWGIYGLANNGFFFDDWSLEQVAAPAPAPEPVAGPSARSLVVNGGFEEGQAYPLDPSGRLRVPAGWACRVDQGQPRGELAQVAGRWVWRVSGEGPAYSLTLFQILSGLVPGRKYRLSARLLPDFPAEAPGGEAGLTARSADRIFETGWTSSARLAEGPGARPALELAFTAPGPRAEIMLELRQTRAGAGAWVVDFLSLEPA